MNKVLIVSDHLLMAGAERLIYEMIFFGRQNNLEMTVLIANNYSIEYYDAIFKKMGIKVIRTTLQNIHKLRNPVNFLKAAYWKIRLKYLSEYTYDSIQVIGLYNADKFIGNIKHSNRFFWHVNNVIQYNDGCYPFQPCIFKNENDTIIYINQYQVDEIIKQYGSENIKCKSQLFKNFIADL
jgi:hypothetical protein